MPILTLKNLCLAFGHHPLLEKVDFQIDRGERVCLIGRNGSGKSSLFKVIQGVILPDEGEIWRQDGIRIAHLEQEVPPSSSLSIYDCVAEGLGNLGQYLRDYHHLVQELETHPQAMQKLAVVQHHIDDMDGWNIQQKISTVLSRLDLQPDALLANCSGGIKRRVMLAKALVNQPDILLLDEPTNHMDIQAIQWLEDFLLDYDGAILFITHDRTFLKRLANRIIELDRGQLYSFAGDYQFFLEKKAEVLNSEAKANERFDKTLADHEVWIRQGIKARRTRNEGRVKILMEMRATRQQRITQQGKINLQLNTGEQSGKLVAELQHVDFNFGEQFIIKNLSTTIVRGDRIGVIGPNGSGKSTLLRLLLGELKPTNGLLNVGTRMQVAYFDQYRSELDLTKSVRENVSDGQDYVQIRGQNKHVVSYLRDFLFPPQRMDSPVSALSGGERNRLLLAKILAKPCNVLILDEPTNDLDMESLELLEELLLEFDGTLILVSHDRSFLDHVVTSTLVFEGNAKVSEYVGGYEDWLRQCSTLAKPKLPPQKQLNVGAKMATSPVNKRKRSYKENTELKELPQQIDTLEQEQTDLQNKMAQTDFYKQDQFKIQTVLDRLKVIALELEKSYKRWAELEN